MRRLPVILILYLCGCAGAVKLAPDDSDIVLARHTIGAPDPTRPGPHDVRHLYYGSGTDRNRAEFRDSVTLRTEPVDASKLVDLGSSAKERNRYWGFTPKEMPLNARVWYPSGDGPFPIVLIVHGNHNMKDFSDPGYEYLGRLLASRGYIFASVDMNFINGSIRGENDARGWFLLKHLQLFERFNAESGNPFEGKVDLTRVVLVGHSRGGEAVGHAASFNRLERYPDDANVEFDFGYGIRGIIAIAPVDGQYRPADRLVPVEDVNYLVFHGSHDGDVSSFMGLRQYQRVRFSGDRPHFKSAVYVYRANHGQWNTVWGPNDNGPRSGRILDLRALMPAEDQRRFAEVYISAFLEATLRNDERYLPLFRDHRVAGEWLPPTMYLTRYEDSSFREVATYEEDVDVASATISGVTISGDSLGRWSEGAMNLRTANSPAEGSSLGNHAVTLGWNNRIAGADTAVRGTPAAYTLSLDAQARHALALDENATLQFDLLPLDGAPGPRKPAASEKDSTKQAVTTSPERKKRDKDEDEDEPAPDLSIELVDANGVAARLPLSRYGAIRKPLEISILRRRDLEKSRYARLNEHVLQTYIVPVADFVAEEPKLNARQIIRVRFVFDRADSGTVLLDQIGVGRAAFSASGYPGGAR